MTNKNRTEAPTRREYDWLRPLTAPAPQKPRSAPPVATLGVNLEALLPAPDEIAPQVAPLDLNFVTAGLHPSVARAHEETQRWLAEIRSGSRQPRWVFLHGRPGCGKTHLARAARQHLTGYGHVQFWKCHRVTSLLRAGEYDLRLQLAKLDVLFLDDIGVDASTAFMRAEWCNLLEERLQKWTFITSNLSPGEIASNIHERVTSRLFRHKSVVVDMSAADDYSFKLSQK